MLFASVDEVGCWQDERWSNFSARELACRCRGRFCGGEYWHDAVFLDAMQALRDEIARPLFINSGHRCAEWNIAVGGAPRSMHRTIAVDISLANQNRHDLLDAAIRHGFTGLGLGKTFLHLDRRQDPARWYYKGSYASWQTG